MFEEGRTSALGLRIRPSLREKMEDARRAKGQSLTEWLERAIEAALEREQAAAG